MQQMELRERIEQTDDAGDPIVALNDLAQELKQQQAWLTSQFSDQYKDKDLTRAKRTALKLQFYERLTQQVGEKQEKYEEKLL